MDRTLILKRFKDIGLSSNEAKSYLCLLQRDTLTVPELSKLGGIPPPNAYRSLEKLMSKGLCISKPGPTKKYAASDPSSLEDKFLGQVDEAIKIELENLKEKLYHGLKQKEKEMSEKRKAAKENIKSLITELRPQYEKGRLETNPLDYIEIIKDPYQIHKRIMQLHAGAKEEILVLTKPPFTGPRQRLKEQIDQQAEVSKAGLRIRSIYEMATDEDEKKWQFEMIERCARGGEEARVLQKLPMKMAIFDSRIVIYVLEDPVSKQPSLTTQIVEHRALAESLKILFETLWEQAEDYHILKD
jgi:DNA-binding MarR family transcriptional regulator